MNIAIDFSETANRLRDKKAILFPVRKGSEYDYQYLTFSELDTKANAYANGFEKIGIVKGKKVLFFVRPSLEFHAIVIALMKIGVRLVFMDPAMGRKNLLVAIDESQPDAIITEPKGLLLKLFFPGRTKSIKTVLTVGSFSWPRTHKLAKLLSKNNKYQGVEMEADATCAILYTSGGTGKPKGVLYSHRIFSQQIQNLKDLFDVGEQDTDLSGFPMFSLFTLVMGMSSVIPDMDTSKPATVDPVKILKNINDLNVSFVSGSPAIWNPVADHCLANNIKLDVKQVVTFGAPVPTSFHRKFKSVLKNGDTYTPYGATESLPVSCISGTEIIDSTANLSDDGNGTCIGLPVPGIEVRIIKTSDDPVAQIEDAEFLPTGLIGELIVKGAVVTQAYFDNPKANELSKIKDGNVYWHRMGDLGYLDAQGRLWFCGRKMHRIETAEGTLYPVACEGIFNTHAAVQRTALVGVKRNGTIQAELVVVKKEGNSIDDKALTEALLDLAKQYEQTSAIKKIHYRANLPVDVRHNIKIDRLALAQMVSQG